MLTESYPASRETHPSPLDQAIQRAGMTDARAHLLALNNQAHAAARALSGHSLGAALRAIALETDQMVDCLAPEAA